MLTRTRPWATVGLIGLTALVGTLFVPLAAQAAEGSPPSSTKEVIGAIHTDAIAPFIDDGTLTLATKADLPAGLGTRLDSDDAIFNVSNAARQPVPNAAYDFLGAVGTDVWIAPETQKSGVIWPGFSTEGISSGATDDNRVTVTLTDATGPGEMDLWESANFGGFNRLFSSRDGAPVPNSYTFAVPQHKHANWAFSAAGTYVLTFEASATIAGALQTASQDYTFVVGDVAAAVETTTSVVSTSPDAVLGSDATLTAAVSPADARGAVEFFDGATSLGYSAVENGVASLVTAALAEGKHSITGTFVPAVTNEFVTSTSAPTTVTVAAAPGTTVFSISGIADSYQNGDSLRATAQGYTLADGEELRWTIRPIGGGTEYYLSDDTGAFVSTATLDRELSLAYNGYEIGARVEKEYVSSSATSYVAITVVGEPVGSGAEITLDGAPDVMYSGDTLSLTVGGTPLAEGERYQVVTRDPRNSVLWVPNALPLTTVDGVTSLSYFVRPYVSSEVAVQIIDAAGAVSGQSPAVYVNNLPRELQFSGVQGVYRDGDVLDASVALYPASEQITTYRWTLAKAGKSAVTIAGATGPSISMPIDMSLNGAKLRAYAIHDNGTSVVNSTANIAVTDAAIGEQVAHITPLAGHYHQGNTIDLNLVASPVQADSDVVVWSMMREDQTEFTPLAGETDVTAKLRAQQPLNNAQVKAELFSASGESLAQSDTVTILVDDHGAAPTEKITVGAPSDHYHPGSPIELSATVDPTSVLDTYRWFVKKTTDAAPVLVEGQMGSTLNLTASPELAGAAVSVTLVNDLGAPFIASAGVLIQIEDHEEEIPQTVLTISASRDADDFWVGQTATLTAVQDTATGLTGYRWSIKLPGADEFTIVEGQNSSTYAFKPAVDLDGVQVKVQLLGDDGVTAHAESAPVTISGKQRAIATEIRVAADKDAYVVGDSATLVSTQSPQTTHEHYHWYIKRVGSSAYVWVDQSRDKDLVLPLTAAENGAQVIIRLFDETHATIAESAPVELVVADAPATDPADPTDLVVPIDPSDPVVPTDPMDPVVPIDPSDPVVPTDPLDPAVPAAPAAPVDPIADSPVPENVVPEEHAREGSSIEDAAVVTTPGALASTGVEIGVAPYLAAFMLMMGGLAVFITRRNRRREGDQ